MNPNNKELQSLLTEPHPSELVDYHDQVHDDDEHELEYPTWAAGHTEDQARARKILDGPNTVASPGKECTRCLEQGIQCVRMDRYAKCAYCTAKKVLVADCRAQNVGANYNVMGKKPVRNISNSRATSSSTVYKPSKALEKISLGMPAETSASQGKRKRISSSVATPRRIYKRRIVSSDESGAEEEDLFVGREGSLAVQDSKSSHKRQLQLPEARTPLAINSPQTRLHAETPNKEDALAAKIAEFEAYVKASREWLNDAVMERKEA